MGFGLIEACVIFVVTHILFILLEFLSHFHHLAMWEVLQNWRVSFWFFYLLLLLLTWEEMIGLSFKWILW